MWVAEIERQDSMPIDQVHVALYGYFPQHPEGEVRPYVWRLLSRNCLLVGSRLRPTANTAREVYARQGVTYDFRLTFRRTRNVCWMKKDGSKGTKTVTISDYGELKRRLKEHVEGRGAGDLAYARITKLSVMRMGKKRIPIAHAEGKVYVRDPVEFDAMLCHGGPGTGKAYGLGMWYLPEIMEKKAHEAA